MLEGCGKRVVDVRRGKEEAGCKSWEVQRDARMQGKGCGCPRLDRSRKSRGGLAGDSASSGKLSPKREVRMRGRTMSMQRSNAKNSNDDGDDDDAMRSGGGLGPKWRARKT